MAHGGSRAAFSNFLDDEEELVVLNDPRRRSHEDLSASRSSRAYGYEGRIHQKGRRSSQESGQGESGHRSRRAGRRASDADPERMPSSRCADSRSRSPCLEFARGEAPHRSRRARRRANDADFGRLPDSRCADSRSRSQGLEYARGEAPHRSRRARRRASGAELERVPASRCADSRSGSEGADFSRRRAGDRTVDDRPASICGLSRSRYGHSNYAQGERAQSSYHTRRRGGDGSFEERVASRYSQSRSRSDSRESEHVDLSPARAAAHSEEPSLKAEKDMATEGRRLHSSRRDKFEKIDERMYDRSAVDSGRRYERNVAPRMQDYETHINSKSRSFDQNYRYANEGQNGGAERQQDGRLHNDQEKGVGKDSRCPESRSRSPSKGNNGTARDFRSQNRADSREPNYRTQAHTSTIGLAPGAAPLTSSTGVIKIRLGPNARQPTLKEDEDGGPSHQLPMKRNTASSSSSEPQDGMPPPSVELQDGLTFHEKRKVASSATAEHQDNGRQASLEGLGGSSSSRSSGRSRSASTSSGRARQRAKRKDKTLFDKIPAGSMLENGATAAVATPPAACAAAAKAAAANATVATGAVKAKAKADTYVKTSILLERLLDASASLKRFDIGEVMVFCLEKAADASWNARQILARVKERSPGPFRRSDIAMLFCISDVLYNSQYAHRCPGVSAYRVLFLDELPSVFHKLYEALLSQADDIYVNSRKDSHHLDLSWVESLIQQLLHSWQEWEIFPVLFLQGLEAILFGGALAHSQQGGDANDERGASDTLLETECRHRALAPRREVGAIPSRSVLQLRLQSFQQYWAKDDLQSAKDGVAESKDREPSEGNEELLMNFVSQANSQASTDKSKKVAKDDRKKKSKKKEDRYLVKTPTAQSGSWSVVVHEPDQPKQPSERMWMKDRLRQMRMQAESDAAQARKEMLSADDLDGVPIGRAADQREDGNDNASAVAQSRFRRSRSRRSRSRRSRSRLSRSRLSRSRRSRSRRSRSQRSRFQRSRSRRSRSRRSRFRRSRSCRDGSPGLSDLEREMSPPGKASETNSRFQPPSLKYKGRGSSQRADAEILAKQQELLQSELSNFNQLLSGIDDKVKSSGAENKHVKEFEVRQETAAEVAAKFSDFLASRSRAPSAPLQVVKPEAFQATPLPPSCKKKEKKSARITLKSRHRRRCADEIDGDSMDSSELADGESMDEGEERHFLPTSVAESSWMRNRCLAMTRWLEDEAVVLELLTANTNTVAARAAQQSEIAASGSNARRTALT